MARLTGQIAGVDLWHGMRRNWAGLVPRRWMGGGERAGGKQPTAAFYPFWFMPPVMCKKQMKKHHKCSFSLRMYWLFSFKVCRVTSILRYALCKSTFRFFREKTSGKKLNVLYIQKSIKCMNFALLLWKWDLTELKRKWKTISWSRVKTSETDGKLAWETWTNQKYLEDVNKKKPPWNQNWSFVVCSALIC